MVLKSSTLGHDEIIEPIFPIYVRTFRIVFCSASPYLLDLRQRASGCDINLKLLDRAGRLSLTGQFPRALEVNPVVVIEKQTRIDPLEINEDGIAPLVRPDVVCVDIEVLSKESLSTSCAIRADNVEPAFMVSDCWSPQSGCCDHGVPSVKWKSVSGCVRKIDLMWSIDGTSCDGVSSRMTVCWFTSNLTHQGP